MAIPNSPPCSIELFVAGSSRPNEHILNAGEKAVAVVYVHRRRVSREWVCARLRVDPGVIVTGTGNIFEIRWGGIVYFGAAEFRKGAFGLRASCLIACWVETF